MFKIFKIMMLFIAMFLSIAVTVNANDEVTFYQLVENAKYYDGKIIKVKGEAVGEAMKRGNHSWVNINDGTLPMGIWMKYDDASKIKVFGDYHNVGDIVEVIGTFNRACIEHGGDMDIHTESIKIVENGVPTPHPINERRIMISAVLTLCAFIIFGVTYKKIK